MDERVCAKCGRGWGKLPGSTFCASQHGHCGVCGDFRARCGCLGSVPMDEPTRVDRADAWEDQGRYFLTLDGRVFELTRHALGWLTTSLLAMRYATPCESSEVYLDGDKTVLRIGSLHFSLTLTAGLAKGPSLLVTPQSEDDADG